ncbi:hypothetical protein BJ944DRAFT_261842 [Cunninghamella echinulata]|nr:hypothetical protein BJ944DRAFT_261842 [Cunninghamella echinulata]
MELFSVLLFSSIALFLLSTACISSPLLLLSFSTFLLSCKAVFSNIFAGGRPATEGKSIGSSSRVDIKVEFDSAAFF